MPNTSEANHKAANVLSSDSSAAILLRLCVVLQITLLDISRNEVKVT